MTMKTRVYLCWQFHVEEEPGSLGIPKHATYMGMSSRNQEQCLPARGQHLFSIAGRVLPPPQKELPRPKITIPRRALPIDS